MKTFIRILHILAITVLIGSAGYAYQTKYETLYYSETLAKTKGKLQREREAIAVAKAEWALLTRPDRLQKMIDKHLDLQPMQISQLGRLADIPARPAREDEISRKLDTLGLETGSLGRPGDKGTKPTRAGDDIARLLGQGAKPAPAHKGVKTADAKPLAKPAASPAPKAPAPSGTKPPEKRAEAKPAPHRPGASGTSAAPAAAPKPAAKPAVQKPVATPAPAVAR